MQHILLINKIIDKARVTKFSLKFQNLGSKNELKIVVFSDASLSNMPKPIKVTIWFCLLWSQGNFSPIWLNSKKIRRVVRSTLAADVLAWAEEIDNSIFLCTLLAELLYGKSDSTTFRTERFIEASIEVG